MLKILTLNLNYYEPKHGLWHDRRKLITKAIEDKAPDIIAFQAVARDPAIEYGKDQAAQFCDIFGDFNYHYFEPAFGNDIQYGSAIISKLPFVECESLKLTLKQGTEDKNPRVLLRAEFDIEGELFFLFNGHFSWVPEQAKNNVTEAVAFFNETNESALLVGDLNTPPDSEVFEPLIKGGWTDMWKAKCRGLDGFTFKSDKPFTRIDYAWANQELKNRFLGIELVKEKNGHNVRMSDHLGLLVSIDM